jgi:hypothetical protein
MHPVLSTRDQQASRTDYCHTVSEYLQSVQRGFHRYLSRLSRQTRAYTSTCVANDPLRRASHAVRQYRQTGFQADRSPSVTLYLCRNGEWQIIDILIMLIGNCENMTRIIRPTSQSDEGCDLIILVNKVSLLYGIMFILDTLYEQTEWTDVVFGFMIVHIVLLYFLEFASAR